MQGAFAMHMQMLALCKTRAIEVRSSDNLDKIDALVIPGGESTAIRKMLKNSGMLDNLRGKIAAGLPVFGTCAGMIVLANAEPDGAPSPFGLLDVHVDRNGYGRQVASFEGMIKVNNEQEEKLGVFIRAPRITSIGEQVEVLATYNAEPVAVRQDNLLAATFHPELTDDPWLHQVFIERMIGK